VRLQLSGEGERDTKPAFRVYGPRPPQVLNEPELPIARVVLAGDRADVYELPASGIGHESDERVAIWHAAAHLSLGSDDRTKALGNASAPFEQEVDGAFELVIGYGPLGRNVRERRRYLLLGGTRDPVGQTTKLPSVEAVCRERKLIGGAHPKTETLGRPSWATGEVVAVVVAVEGVVRARHQPLMVGAVAPVIERVQPRLTTSIVVGVAVPQVAHFDGGFERERSMSPSDFDRSPRSELPARELAGHIDQHRLAHRHAYDQPEPGDNLLVDRDASVLRVVQRLAPITPPIIGAEAPRPSIVARAQREDRSHSVGLGWSCDAGHRRGSLLVTTPSGHGLGGNLGGAASGGIASGIMDDGRIRCTECKREVAEFQAAGSGRFGRTATT
jgi:hypothetical protein